jgi:hypothetical protein
MKSLFLTAAFLAGIFTGNLGLAMEGTLSVSNGSLRVVRDDGFKVHFYPGKYQSEIELQDDRALIVVYRNGIRTDINLNYPRGTRLPDSGHISIDGATTGQTFSISGDRSVTTTDSNPVRTWEDCTFSRTEWVCEGYGRHQRCEWRSVRYRGTQDVEYFVRTMDVDLQLGLKSNNGGLAEFAGQTSRQNKIYLFRGQCF